MGYKTVMKTTDNSALYNKAKIRRSMKDKGICPYCPLKGGENEGLWGRKIKRSWKQYRKVQYK